MMRRSIRLLSVVVLLATSAVIGVAAPAGARRVAPVVSFVMQPVGGLVVPNTNISSKLNFQPSRLKAVWTGTEPATCTIANAGATVTNRTNKTVTLMSDGKTFFALTGHSVGGICGWGSGKGSFLFGLAGSTKLLRVRFS